MIKGKVSPEEIKKMQSDPEMIRNICILAHVDHGKTTLSDSLISSNHIISQKLAGKLKYLDSRDDEQQRQITMKASSITLFHQKVQRIKKEEREAGVVPQTKLFKINLMDSPGHVDFTNEVSSALRLSDGALILIDCVEGVSPQSLTVLRQAWDEKIRTCLVLNKLDRLIVERNMDADDIFQHCQCIIEQVNAIISSFISETNMQKYIKSAEENKEEGLSDEENDENKFFYSPEKGNVAFTSAVDGWGFTVPSFAYLLAKKLGAHPKKLRNYLWGEFYFSKGKITRKMPTKNSKVLATQFIFQPIVAEYRKEFDIIDEYDSSAVSKAIEKISQVLNKRIPLDKGIFDMVVNRLPSPKSQQKERLEVFCPALADISDDISSKPLDMSEEEFKTLTQIKGGIKNCDNSEESPLIIYVSKMQPIDTKAYAVATKNPSLNQGESTRLIAFGRVFSGKIERGKEYYIFGATHSKERKDVIKMRINDIFILMGGNSLKQVKEMNAGNIVGIGGLDNAILKMGTISSHPDCPSFTPAKLFGTGLIKVSIQPTRLSDMPILIEGLRKLDKADPSVSYFLNEKGEYILQTCGQIHLERCIKDLKDDFAQIDIEISEPIITFKETPTLKVLRRESDFNHIVGEGDWFEQDEEEIERKANEIIEKQKNAKLKGKRKHKDSSDEEEEKEGEGDEGDEEEEKEEELKFIYEEEEKEEELKFIYEEEKLDQTDMYIERAMCMKNPELRNNLYKTRGWVIGYTPNRKLRVRIRTVGLPFELTKFLENNETSIKLMNHLISTETKKNQNSTIEEELKIANEFLSEFKQNLIDNE